MLREVIEKLVREAVDAEYHRLRQDLRKDLLVELQKILPGELDLLYKLDSGIQSLILTKVTEEIERTWDHRVRLELSRPACSPFVAAVDAAKDPTNKEHVAATRLIGQLAELVLAVLTQEPDKPLRVAAAFEPEDTVA